jgi:hypothetical protein
VDVNMVERVSDAAAHRAKMERSISNRVMHRPYALGAG